MISTTQRLRLALFAVVDKTSRISWDDVALQREAFDMPADPNMKWEKSSGDLVALFSEIAPKDAGVEQKKMFGWPCCFVNGNLFAGLHKQSVIFRLSETGSVDLPGDGGSGGIRAHARPQDEGLCDS